MLYAREPFCSYLVWRTEQWMSCRIRNQQFRKLRIRKKERGFTSIQIRLTLSTHCYNITFPLKEYAQYSLITISWIVYIIRSRSQARLFVPLAVFLWNRLHVIRFRDSFPVRWVYLKQTKVMVLNDRFMSISDGVEMQMAKSNFIGFHHMEGNLKALNRHQHF